MDAKQEKAVVSKAQNDEGEHTRRIKGGLDKNVAPDRSEKRLWPVIDDDVGEKQVTSNIDSVVQTVNEPKFDS